MSLRLSATSKLATVANIRSIYSRPLLINIGGGRIGDILPRFHFTKIVDNASQIAMVCQNTSSQHAVGVIDSNQRYRSELRCEVPRD